jgi:hypothetical protein
MEGKRMKDIGYGKKKAMHLAKQSLSIISMILHASSMAAIVSHFCNF